MEKTVKRIYDGALHCDCGSCSNCPVVDHDAQTGVVTLYDPAKPLNGKFTMTVKEYNALLGNAPKVKEN